MSKHKTTLLAVSKEGMSQSETAASPHVGKRNVSVAARVARKRGLTFDEVSAMDVGALDAFFPRDGGDPDPVYLGQT